MFDGLWADSTDSSSVRQDNLNLLMPRKLALEDKASLTAFEWCLLSFKGQKTPVDVHSHHRNTAAEATGTPLASQNILTCLCLVRFLDFIKKCVSTLRKLMVSWMGRLENHSVLELEDSLRYIKSIVFQTPMLLIEVLNAWCGKEVFLW